MGLILHDFKCEYCGATWEDLVERNNPTCLCPACDKENSPILSAPGIAAYSIMDRDAQAECLMKRSAEHTKKLMKKDRDEIQHRYETQGKKLRV